MSEAGPTPLVLVAGTAIGKVLRLDEPLSFWGGVETLQGRIIDQRHPQVGEIVAGRILVMPFGRGSSSGSSVICEAVRAGTAPAAILMAERDDIIALGAIKHIALEKRWSVLTTDIARAYGIGKQAAPLLSVYWEHHWATPIEEVRSRYRIETLYA